MDYSSEPNTQASNPFLQDFGEPTSTAVSDNPFLNYSEEPVTYQPPTDSTNPFAFFEPSQDAQNIPEPPPPATTTTAEATNLFGTEDKAENLFGPLETEQYSHEIGLFSPPQEPALFSPPQEPVLFSPPEEPNLFSPPQEKALFSPPQETALFSPPKETTSPSQPKNGRPLPSRPPPPARPAPPAPPKHTQDLILSVTGTMDATSNHLLDRLQATRTPSPTLLHSPSPTPEHSFADLLDVDSNVPDLIPDDNHTNVETKTDNMLDLFDAPVQSENTASSIFSPSAMGVDTVTQSSNEPIFTTDVTITPSIVSENPFNITEDTQIVEVSPVEDILQVEKLSIDVPTSTGFDYSSDVPTKMEESVPEIPEFVETNVFTQDNSSVGYPITEVSETFSNVSTNIFGAEPVFTTAETNQVTENYVPIVQNNIFTTNVTGHDYSLPAEGDDFGLAAEYPGSDYHVEERLDNFASTTNTGDAFDAFTSKFEMAAEPEGRQVDAFGDAFGSSSGQTAMDTSSDGKYFFPLFKLIKKNCII